MGNVFSSSICEIFFPHFSLKTAWQDEPPYRPPAPARRRRGAPVQRPMLEARRFHSAQMSFGPTLGKQALLPRLKRLSDQIMLAVDGQHPTPSIARLGRIRELYQISVPTHILHNIVLDPAQERDELIMKRSEPMVSQEQLTKEKPRWAKTRAATNSRKTMRTVFKESDPEKLPLKRPATWRYQRTAERTGGSLAGSFESKMVEAGWVRE
eukprot:Skav228126  [mRNA]  locus=scaffold1220:316474:319478:+ [translate_table: standard]